VAVGVVGGGIVGLAIARELLHRRPGIHVEVFEKEPRLAAHQTGHNSGVVHAGLYYRAGSLKAELCSAGRLLLRDFCAQHGVAYDPCGKLVVAVDDAELGRLTALEGTARGNGVPGLRRLTGPELREVEPHASGVAALHSPQTAVTDFVAVAQAMARDIEDAGGTIEVSAGVTEVRTAPDGVDVVTPHGVRRVEHLVVCAGLQADRVGAGPRGAGDVRIVPFRGEYLRVADAKRDLVHGMIYPVPDPRYPFLGVHFTRRSSGELEVGPNAVLALDREGYRRRDGDAADVRDIITWPGFWRLAGAHWRTGLRELRGSLSRRAFMRAAQRYVPEIGPDDVVRSRVGIRAQAVARDGTLLDDFRILQDDRVTRILNAPSPAATSSLAIAAHVVDGLRLG
jgi:L-2-hydroxyglutarate oxidase LhgO